ncbi:MAG: TonB-dependent receptor [Cellvibrionales bacterium]|nr:TonB-dependent receptor [Cellvibrionales bacterium]
MKPFQGSRWLKSLGVLLVSSTVFAEEALEEVTVQGVKQRLDQQGALSDTIMKTEVISSDDIQNKNAINLSEALEGTPGVRVNNECSMCGVKRILLNGMKGEQTTILVDGLPSHTLISGFYAVDAIPTTGIERIDVARGAGASLIAPEAIGGVVNIITKEATENGAELDISGGENGFKKLGFLGTGVSEDGTAKATLIAQYDVREQFDADDNGVSESPFLENMSLISRFSKDIGMNNHLSFRAAHIRSEIFGGPMLGQSFADGKISSPSDAIERFDGEESDALFVGGNVKNKYLGKAWELTEWIETQRDELSASWLSELTDKWNMSLSTSYAKHVQDSFYEGFDYQAKDEMLFLDAKFNWVAHQDHLITFGVDQRMESLRSHSKAGLESKGYVSDSFDYNVSGIYLQDTWQLSDSFEVALAVRVDQVKADFTDPEKTGVEIDKTIASPRIDMRYFHNDYWTSRLSGGQGYRAPLSFFESDHGMLDTGEGFRVDIDDLERSLSTTYALSYENAPFTATLSVAYTEVDNLATITEEVVDTDGVISMVPLLTQLEETASVSVADLALGYQATNNLGFDLIIESFFYDKAFRESYSIAPSDKRVTFNMDWDINQWELITTVVWFGEKDLNDYGYDAYDQVSESGSENPVVESSKKTTTADAYFIVNSKVQRELGENLSAYIGVNNLLNETQAGNGESPLMFDDEGGIDVAYIHGSLRGREAYAGVTWKF